jgi:hypothetical protein
VDARGAAAVLWRAGLAGLALAALVLLRWRDIVVLAAFASAGTTTGRVALGIFVAHRQLEGAVLQPMVQRRTVSLGALAVGSAVLLGTAAACSAGCSRCPSPPPGR